MPTTLAPISLRKEICSTKSFSTSSYGFVRRNEENQALQICILRSERAFLSAGMSSRGYLLPTSQPVKPARAISEIHCSKVFSEPKSGISSFVQAIGAIPNLTLFLSSISIFPRFTFVFFFIFVSLVDRLVVGG